MARLRSDQRLPTINDSEDTAIVGQALDSKYFFRKAGVTSFFIQTMLDLPRMLKKSKSLFSDTFRSPETRLLNLLMRHGRRRLVGTAWGQACMQFTHAWTRTLKGVRHLDDWFVLSHVAGGVAADGRTLVAEPCLTTTHELWLTRSIFKEHYYFAPEFTLREFLLHLLQQQNPLFMFFIKKNDKMRRKHGRGKVEKLKVMWKYIPPYKRLYQAMRWLLRDLRFQKQASLTGRMHQIIDTLFTNPSASFLFKTQQFIHRFVYKKYQKTLLRTLRTTA